MSSKKSLARFKKKIKNNFIIYRTDIKQKGIYWSVVHRLYKIPLLRILLSPLVNYIKPNFIMYEGNKLYIDKWDEAISQFKANSGKNIRLNYLKKILKLAM
jgi:hypothetical protein